MWRNMEMKYKNDLKGCKENEGKFDYELHLWKKKKTELETELEIKPFIHFYKERYCTAVRLKATSDLVRYELHGYCIRYKQAYV